MSLALLLRIATGVIIGAFMSYKGYRYYNQRNRPRSEQLCAGSTVADTGRCVVCWKDFERFSRRVLLICGHPTHPHCSVLLLEQGVSNCPMCRKNLQQEVQERACSHSHEEQVEQPPLFPSDKNCNDCRGEPCSCTHLKTV